MSSDPLTFKTRAVLEGNEWVINGEKWFSSGAYGSTILIVYAVTDPDHKNPYERTSIFIVPTATPGASRSCAASMWAPARSASPGGHGYMRYTNVRVPYGALLGERGGAFKIAQTRLSGGRVPATPCAPSAPASGRST